VMIMIMIMLMIMMITTTTMTADEDDAAMQEFQESFTRFRAPAVLRGQPSQQNHVSCCAVCGAPFDSASERARNMKKHARCFLTSELIIILLGSRARTRAHARIAI
jgi:hypothetical protein